MATTYQPGIAPSHRTRPGADLAEAVQRQLHVGLGDEHGPLGTAAEHAVAAAGKLLRPQLVLEACRAVGGDPAAALPAAVGTELGHIASLVHDDIIDGDDVRRGQSAVHFAFGVPLAILTGDLLVFEMFASYADSARYGVTAERTLRAIQILSHTCIDVCRGQALEAEVAGALETTEATYFEVIRLKTAGVCRAAAEIGATLGGGTSAEVDVLGAYGEALGMAFQVVDDVLEYAGQPDTLGKPVDSDLRNERMTLPLIYALHTGPQTRGALVTLLRASDYCALAEFLDDAGMLARARQTAAGFAHTAQRLLESLPPSEARAHLRKYAVDVLKRDR